MSDGPKPAALVLDPARAQAEMEAAKINLDEPCTKKEMMQYLENFWRAHIAGIVQMQNNTAGVLNLLMDFLTHRGLGNSNHGRYFLSTAEWNEYILMKRQAAEAEAKLKALDQPPAPAPH